MPARARGFTLIELMMVVLILATASAVVALKLQGPMGEARMKDVTGQIASYDRLTRLQASEQDRTLMVVIDPDKGELRRMDPEGEAIFGTPLSLPSDFGISRVLVAGEDTSSKKKGVCFSRLGVSRSYAVHVTGPGRLSRWILFTGLAGEVVEVESEDQAREIMDKAAEGNNAG